MSLLEHPPLIRLIVHFRRYNVTIYFIVFSTSVTCTVHVTFLFAVTEVRERTSVQLTGTSTNKSSEILRPKIAGKTMLNILLCDKYKKNNHNKAAVNQ